MLIEKKMKKLILNNLLSVLFFSGLVFSIIQCTEKPKTPNAKVTVEKMGEIVSDLTVGFNEMRQAGVPQDSLQIYFDGKVKPEILEKHGVSVKEFDALYKKYESDAEIMNQLLPLTDSLLKKKAGM